MIRRMDMDGDAKINPKEFNEAVRPLESFTINKKTKTLSTSMNKSVRPKSSLSKLRSSKKMTTGSEYGQNMMMLSSNAFNKSPKTPTRSTSSILKKQSFSRNTNVYRT